MKCNREQFRLAATPVLLGMAFPMSVPVLAQESSSIMLEEVVVTARRKDESLQDVPQTVNAVDAETFQKLNILNFQDMQSVVPGVTLDSENNGYTNQASMRGVSYDPTAQTSASVEFYLNDAPVSSGQIFTQVFDVGQVEVLRGPQGTLRGRSAPSGAITVRTRDVNYSEYEGYLSSTLTNKGGSNYQGAINIPLVSDMLALRLAGVMDESEANHVDSVFSDADSDADIKGFRATLGFSPTENIDSQLMHQRISKDLVTFEQQAGQNRSLPHHASVGYVAPEDRVSLMGSPNDVKNITEVTTLNVNWLVGGLEVSYVGSYSELVTRSNSPEDEINWIAESDATGLSASQAALLVDEWYQNLHLMRETRTHELRISPEEPVADFFSYTVGVFYEEQEGLNLLDRNSLLGIVGSSGTPSGVLVYTLPMERPSESDELSGFVNGTFFLSDATELSLGARQIRTHTSNETYMRGSRISSDSSDDNELIWNASLSHRFSDDLMTYANAGTAVRPAPLGTLGIRALATPDANMEKVLFRDNERSISYELGIKWDFMNGRGRLNAAYYYQEFDGFLHYSPSILYFGSNGVDDFNFTTNADAEVQGVDIDVSFQLTEEWTASAVLAWNDSELQSEVPCNDASRPLDANNQVNFCATGDKASTMADWSMAVRSEYASEVSDGLEGYVRGIYSYTPENDNQHQFTTIDAYGLLNLYVGLRDVGGSWDLQLFAKNVTGEEQMTSLEDLQIGEGSSLATALGDSGYYTARSTPLREVGISVRYNFGS
ncbi:TonB-dependent receptor [Pseudomaricurvus sp. HS19]|uniref:TonB-dependent receptor n=1 Tax=Pseudomaricurvus sp. HS19 TaxID=2692626 RepID=UPI00137178E1|nr:TonB-dependent receptor [Pseudomaricurvus sp. HS19]MYM64275.1 TonB-dependent receptor [Pseudomaricurvus sp. HS19]